MNCTICLNCTVLVTYLWNITIVIHFIFVSVVPKLNVSMNTPIKNWYIDCTHQPFAVFVVVEELLAVVLYDHHVHLNLTSSTHNQLIVAFFVLLLLLTRMRRRTGMGMSTRRRRRTRRRTRTRMRTKMRMRTRTRRTTLQGQGWGGQLQGQGQGGQLQG